MDYRERRYFLVSFNYSTRDMRMKNLKMVDPSVKFNPPYGHLPDTKWGYDGERCDITGLSFPTTMMSCSKDKVDAVLYELRKTVGEDHYSGYYELNKSCCRH